MLLKVLDDKSYKEVMKLENKKAQGLSITTLILIIIGVVILVVLIFGFTAGWGNIKGWLAPSSNVDQIVSQCSVACASEMKYDWCTKQLTVKRKDVVDVTDTCDNLGNDEDLGIADCPAIEC